MADISQSPFNLIRDDGSGALEAMLYIRNEDDSPVILTGAGTREEPLTAHCTLQQQEKTQLRRSDDFITLKGDGSAKNPFEVGHKQTATPGLYNGFQIDSAGHIINYTQPDSSNVVRLVQGKDGIHAQHDPATGITTVSLTGSVTSLVSGTYRFGAYDVQFEKNRVERVTRVTTLVPGVYKFGDYLVQLDEYGMILQMAVAPKEPEPEPEPEPEVPAPAPTQYAKLFPVSTEENAAREIKFTTTMTAGFRITYQSNAMPDDLKIYIDGAEVVKHTIGTLRAEALSPAEYLAGDHIVTVMTVREGGFTDAGFLDVTLVRMGT